MNKIPVKLLQSPVVLVEYNQLIIHTEDPFSGTEYIVVFYVGPDALQGFMQ